MGIIKKNGISYSGGGSGGGGGGGTPVVLITHSEMEQLVDEETYDPNTVYLVQDDETEIVYAVFYDGWYYGVGKTGSINREMTSADWSVLVGSDDPNEWDVLNVDEGWYFIYNEGDLMTDNMLIYVVHVLFDGDEKTFTLMNINSPSPQQSVSLMTQAEYDFMLSEGRYPAGFAYCEDTRNLYWQMSPIVENTPPV